MKILKKFLLINSLLMLNLSLIADDTSLLQFIINIFVKNSPEPIKTKSNQNDYLDPIDELYDDDIYKDEQVNYTHVRKVFFTTFDTIFATPQQSKPIQKELERVRNKSSNEVIQRLQIQFGNLSEEQSKWKAREFARSAALEFVVERAERIAADEIGRIRINPPINPSQLRSVYSGSLIHKIKQEVLADAQNNLTDTYGSLREYAGDQLYRKISFKVEQEFGIHDRQAQSINYDLPTPRPSAPPLDESEIILPPEIQEIYPKSGLPNEIFKEEACCVCQEDFISIGKRVILKCGHTICPTCIYQWLYIQNKNTCPLCRSLINKSDFTPNNLG